MQNKRFVPGQQARILEDTEISGYTDGDLDQEFSVLIHSGTIVEIVDEPISAGNIDDGTEEMVVAIKLTDRGGVDRIVLAGLDELSPQVLMN